MVIVDVATTEGIRLGQFLKLAHLAPTGGIAKALISGGCVHVNGSIDTRRARLLHAGDIVSIIPDDAGVFDLPEAMHARVVPLSTP